MTTDIEEKMLKRIEVLFQCMTEIMQTPINKSEKIERMLFLANLMVQVKNEDFV